MVKKYSPKKGDLVKVNFNLQAGHEQQGWRPGLVISNTAFNIKMGLAIVCPIINTDRNIPFHIAIENNKLTGFVMTEQVKSIDYNARKIQFVATIRPRVLQDVLAVVNSVIF